MLNGALLVIGVLLLAYSAEPLYHAATNSRQITLTCEDLVKSPPRALWLRVTGCEMDYLGAGFREQNGRIVELYFPARPIATPRARPAPLVAKTSDPEVLSLAEGTMGGGRTPSQEQFLVMMLKIVTALRAAREIEGYGEDNVVDRLNTRADLSSLSTPPSPDAPVVELHARPSLLGPGATAATGILLFGMVVVLRAKRRKDGRSARESLSPGTRSAVLAQPTLRLMLLNLPHDAGREAIEHAPPLGRRDEVVAALTSVLGELHFDATGRVTLEDPESQVTVDIGPTDPVPTAVIHARGNVESLLRGILDRTGWRAFEAKTGAFFATREPYAAQARPLDHTAA